MSLGKKIKVARLENELGEKVDCTGRYIGQIERGERNASLSKVILIAKTLNVSIDYLTDNFTPAKTDDIDGRLSYEIKSISNKQKETIIDIIKIIKRFN